MSSAEALAIERELYSLDALLVEQQLPVPQPTLAPDLWHCPRCLLPVPECLGAINAHVRECSDRYTDDWPHESSDLETK